MSIENCGFVFAKVTGDVIPDLADLVLSLQESLLETSNLRILVIFLNVIPQNLHIPVKESENLPMRDTRGGGYPVENGFIGRRSH